MSPNPPKPRFALSVGVIGHRPDRLPEEARGKVAADIDDFLARLSQAALSAQSAKPDCFDRRPPLLSMISALAEGADRIAAHAAIKAKMALDAPLPFEQTEYEKDFATPGTETESLIEFRQLYGPARSKLELPGDRAFANRAYEAAGLTVIAQSDIVLVVWDGGPSKGRGGTTEMIQFVLRAGIPLVHVDATGKAPTKIIWHGLAPLSPANEVIEETASAGLEDLDRVVYSVTRPPSDAGEQQDIARYFAEENNHCRMRPEFPWLQKLARVRPKFTMRTKPPNPNEVSPDFLPSDVKREQVEVLAAAYGWADGLGLYYAQTFRGAYVMNFMLSALAVVAAALSLLISPKWPFVLFEVVCIVVVLINTSIGYRQDWQSRWLETREVAERLRGAVPLWRLGFRPGNFSGEEPLWTGWYVRALFREQGMCAASLNAEAMQAAKKSLLLLLKDQCDYHRDKTAPRMKTLNHVLEKAGEGLLLTTLGVASLYLLAAAGFSLAGMLFPGEEIVKHVVAAASAALPALATAFYGIRVIGDFEGNARRSVRMDETLRKLSDAIQKDNVDIYALRARAKAASEIMLSDVASWRLVAESRALPTV